MGLFQQPPREAAGSRRVSRVPFAVRSLLECEAIKLAVHNITPVQICLMEEEIQKEEQTFTDKDPDTYLKINSNCNYSAKKAQK